MKKKYIIGAIIGALIGVIYHYVKKSKDNDAFKEFNNAYYDDDNDEDEDLFEGETERE